MPEIKLQQVVSFSSEDLKNPAENLLNHDGYKKWKGGAVGEKQVSVTLQFDKPYKIQSIDIGNDGSAFVEVLVGRASATSDQDYQVILVTSSFMSPVESKNSSNLNRVRMFGPEKLSKAVSDQKWDRVKVVCTQPFNKAKAYGLSFVKFHRLPEEGEEAKSEQEGGKKLGMFKLKDDSSEIKAGTLFASRNKEPAATPLTGAAAMRAASRLADDAHLAAKIQEKERPTPQARPEQSREHHTTKPSTPVPTKRKHEDEGHHSSHKKHHEDRKRSSTSSLPSTPSSSSKPSLHKHHTSDSSSASSSKRDGQPPLKKTKSEPSRTSPEKPFHKLLEGVVFVLSGFQNPFRSELRDKALEMGAKYKGDWDKSCTHLICAFINTPKYNQVRGKGKIVSKHWVLDTHRKRKARPWKKYRLGDESSSESSSEEEEEMTPKAKKPSPVKENARKAKDEDSPKKAAKVSPKKSQTMEPGPSKQTDVNDSDDFAGSTDVEDDSPVDTDDEIQRVKAEQKRNTPVKKPAAAAAGGDEDPFGGSTDEEMEVDEAVVKEECLGLPELPNFFSNKHFFLYGTLKPLERRSLVRFITAFNGELEDYMDDKVQFVVTAADWDDNFDQALSDNPNLQFVRPDWVFACHDKGKLMPHQKFMVVPV